MPQSSRNSNARAVAPKQFTARQRRIDSRADNATVRGAPGKRPMSQQTSQSSGNPNTRNMSETLLTSRDRMLLERAVFNAVVKEDSTFKKAARFTAGMAGAAVGSAVGSLASPGVGTIAGGVTGDVAGTKAFNKTFGGPKDKTDKNVRKPKGSVVS